MRLFKKKKKEPLKWDEGVELVQMYIPKTGTNSTMTKIGATAVFGIVGLAATSGTKNKKQTFSKPIIRVCENGLECKNDKRGYRMRIPWEEISTIQLPPYSSLTIFDQNQNEIHFDDMSRDKLEELKTIIESRVFSEDDDGW